VFGIVDGVAGFVCEAAVGIARGGGGAAGQLHCEIEVLGKSVWSI
jgi:hypothetical protein